MPMMSLTCIHSLHIMHHCCLCDHCVMWFFACIFFIFCIMLMSFAYWLYALSFVATGFPAGPWSCSLALLHCHIYSFLFLEQVSRITVYWVLVVHFIWFSCQLFLSLIMCCYCVFLWWFSYFWCYIVWFCVQSLPAMVCTTFYWLCIV